MITTRNRAGTRCLASLLLAAASACSSDNTTVPDVTPTSLAIIEGSDAQVGVVGQAVNPLEVVVRNAEGTAVPNVTVTWTVISGAGFVSAATSVTDSTGLATVLWTLGTVSGTDSISASVAGATGVSVTLSATARPGAVTALVKSAGDGQEVVEGAPSAPFVVKAVDVYGNGVPSVAVTWSATTGGVLTSTTSTTGTDGTTSDTLIANVLSTFQVDAALQANNAVQVVFSASDQ